MSEAASASPRPTVSTDQPTTIGPYRVLARLGQGGMGVVYRAAHVETGRVAAVKTVLLDAQAGLESIRREIRALARLRHPGIARITDEGVDGGRPWYAMELLQGRSLRDYAGAASSDPEGRRLATATILRVARRLCSPLAFLHGEGVVHRDLKPENILVTTGERPVLIDFGLATEFEGRLRLGSLDVSNARTGTVLYVAPEVLMGSSIDARADLYSFGCILYELLAGEPPFGGSVEDVAHGHLFGTPAPLRVRAPGLPAPVYALLERLLAKSPRDRIGYAADVAAALGACLGEADSPREPDEPPPRAYVYRPGFAGRDRSLATMLDELGNVASGTGAFVVVRGETGVGKTRLLLEVAGEADARSVTILTGECAQQGGAPLEGLRKPLQAIAGQLRLQGPGEIERVLGPRGKVLATYVPELAALPGQELHPAPARLPTREAAEARLFESLTETLAAFLGARPAMLAIDDVHWADELTLGFLRHLARAPMLTRMPLLVVASYRAEEESRAIRELREEAGVVDLPLERLGDAAIASIVDDMLALSPAPPAFASYLSRQTEGNPFFVAEYLRLAVSEGIIARDPSGFWRLPECDGATAAPAAYESLALPRSLHDVISRRLEALASDAAVLASAAAVLGRECEHAILAATSGLEDEPFQAARDELIRRQILEETRSLALRFTHAKLREVAYGALDPAQRIELHRRAAAAIDAHCTSEPGDAAAARRRAWASSLAVHYHRGGQLEAAARTYALAAQHAANAAAFIDTIQHLCGAVDALDELPETPEILAQKVDLRLELFGARRMVHTSATEESFRLCAETEALAKRLGDGSRLSAVHANFVSCFYARAEYDECIEYGCQVMDHAERIGDLRAVAAVAFTVMTAYVQTGRVAEVVARCSRLIAQIEAAGARLDALGNISPPYVPIAGALAWAYGLMGRPRDAARWAESAVKAATDAQNRYAIAIAHAYAGGALASCEDGKAILAHASEGLRISRECRFPAAEVFAHYSFGIGNAFEGRYAEAVDWFERGLAMAKSAVVPIVQTNAHAGLALAHLGLGDTERAVQACLQGLAFAERAGERKLDAELHRLLAEARMAQPEPNLDDAAHHLEASFAIIARQGTLAFSPRARIALGRLHAARGEREQARAELARALDEARALGLAPHERDAEAALRSLSPIGGRSTQ